jgi:hypothetical protein
MSLQEEMSSLFDICSKIKNLTVHSVTSRQRGASTVLVVSCVAKHNAQHNIPKRHAGYDVIYVFEKRSSK